MIKEILSHQRAAEEHLFAKAAKSADHNPLQPREADYRLPYKRDVDRIVHSKAYARYIDKTQVAYAVENDHVTHRVLHVQLVSNFARGIAEILRLNVDLVEAIALGHDVGHPPFAHDGEEILDEIAKELGEPGFNHTVQSCRLFREIEPLNLGLAVYDGFLCHDGGMEQPFFAPEWDKTWETHLQGDSHMPMTLEGCLVKLCDTVSYLARDIEDAIRLNVIKREDLPRTPLGQRNSDILSRIAEDIIVHSYEQEKIALSQEMFEALKELRAFNYSRIYLHSYLKHDRLKVERAYRILIDTLLEDPGYLFNHYLEGRNEAYLATATPVQKVIDYVAGMTDRYFTATLKELVMP